MPATTASFVLLHNPSCECPSNTSTRLEAGKASLLDFLYTRSPSGSQLGILYPASFHFPRVVLNFHPNHSFITLVPLFLDTPPQSLNRSSQIPSQCVPLPSSCGCSSRRPSRRCSQNPCAIRLKSSLKPCSPRSAMPLFLWSRSPSQLRS